MKRPLVFFLGLIAGLIILFCTTFFTPLEIKWKTKCDTETLIPPNQGIQISGAQFITMRDSFQNNLARLKAKAGQPGIDTGSWGGRIGRISLQNLIDSLPQNVPHDQQFIQFNFGLSAGLIPKTCVMFISQGNPGQQFFISSGVPGSYCPPRCPVPNQ